MRDLNHALAGYPSWAEALDARSKVYEKLKYKKPETPDLTKVNKLIMRSFAK